MADTSKKTVFDTLNGINVNEHTEKKNGLTYLSWAWAWAEVKKAYPDANYEIEKFNGIPYVYDPMTGYMVYTRVTIDGITHEMWLPVMDSNNKAMKAEPYKIVNNYGKETTVKAATMFDVNKTIMRCLVKNLAMFGMALYIYAGEDLPEESAPPTFTCAACGNTFTDAVTAEKSMQRWKKHICIDCIRKKQAETRQKALEKARKEAEAVKAKEQAEQIANTTQGNEQQAEEPEQIPLPFEF